MSPSSLKCRIRLACSHMSGWYTSSSRAFSTWYGWASCSGISTTLCTCVKVSSPRQATTRSNLSLSSPTWHVLKALSAWVNHTRGLCDQKGGNLTLCGCG